jgi:hypothetical protein
VPGVGLFIVDTKENAILLAGLQKAGTPESAPAFADDSPTDRQMGTMEMSVAICPGAQRCAQKPTEVSVSPGSMVRFHV